MTAQTWAVHIPPLFVLGDDVQVTAGATPFPDGQVQVNVYDGDACVVLNLDVTPVAAARLVAELARVAAGAPSDVLEALAATLAGDLAADVTAGRS